MVRIKGVLEKSDGISFQGGGRCLRVNIPGGGAGRKIKEARVGGENDG